MTKGIKPCTFVRHLKEEKMPAVLQRPSETIDDAKKKKKEKKIVVITKEGKKSEITRSVEHNLGNNKASVPIDLDLNG